MPSVSRHALMFVAICLMVAPPAQAKRPTFQAWQQALWPEAQALGVTRATFDAAFKGLTPDYKLPDLKRPGQKVPSSKGQAEFTRPPSAYIDRAYIMRLAKTGRALAKKHGKALAAIEQQYGVDRYSLLAIWGRETAFGRHKLRHDAIRVLATLAYAGRRADVFRKELLAALQLLQSGVPRKRMRSSWAGAMGLTQFMPTEFATYAKDFDGDGEANVFSSVPDALASAAAQLAGKGWVRGHTWGYEVIVPASADCAYEGPVQERPISAWGKLGFQRVAGRQWPSKVMDQTAYLMMPGGAYGPAFLVTENFKVLRRYNMSDLYAVFVGHLADRIAGGGDFVTPWTSNARQRTDVIAAIQERLQKAGYPVSIVDGKIGSNTRQVVGLYQRLNKLRIDCWPS
ncbi:MAG: lytic murein transglycosylase, partial [Alphaproteobacteria bacterium]|nr:lytic murein transglycosylase [Alphaproteobacteria bacterium]